MGRALLLVSLLSIAFTAGYGTSQLRLGLPLLPAQLLPAGTATPLLAPTHHQSCSDDCEQEAVVHHATEGDVRACKARCNDPVYAQPHEVPRSISVAPADHHR